jgi:hypothetical protein
MALISEKQRLIQTGPNSYVRGAYVWLVMHLAKGDTVDVSGQIYLTKEDCIAHQTQNLATMPAGYINFGTMAGTMFDIDLGEKTHEFALQELNKFVVDGDDTPLFEIEQINN